MVFASVCVFCNDGNAEKEDAKLDIFPELFVPDLAKALSGRRFREFLIPNSR